MSYNKKVDANQKEIVNHFRNLGCSVFITSTVGQGYPDISVGTDGITLIGNIPENVIKYLKRNNITFLENSTILVEIKTNTGSLNKSQKKFVSDWNGNFLLIRSTEDIDEIFRTKDSE